jgi:hypothetical protein
MKIGDRVWVFDRYRFAVPKSGTIVKFADNNDGVEVVLDDIGSFPPMSREHAQSCWVHSQQLTPFKK